MIYFDNAATTYPKPKEVILKANYAMREAAGNPGRSSHRLAMLAADEIYRVREKTAELFSYSKCENVVFTENATYALNTVIKSAVKSNDHVLIGDMEHNSVLRPILRLKRDKIIDYDIFETKGDAVENIKKKIKPNTTLVIVNHVSNVNSQSSDIYRIGRFCKEKGYKFIIDASQSAGHVKIDMEKSCANAICAPGHKGLFGITGCGFIIFSFDTALPEFIDGGSGSESKNPYMPSELPERYEAGTLPCVSIMTLGAGIDFINKVTLDFIEEKESTLLRCAYELLSDIKGIKLYYPDNLSGNVISLSHGKISPDKLGELMSKKGFCTRCGFHCAPLAHKTLGTWDEGTMRLGFSYFNTKKEIEKFYKELKDTLSNI